MMESFIKLEPYQGVLSTFNETMNHVKPHGALYNMAAKDPALAEAIAQAVKDVSPKLILFGLSESELTKAGEKIGLRTAHEVFADRTYQPDGSLTPRDRAGALITDIDLSIAQVLNIVNNGHVRSLTKEDIPLRADTICIHGDRSEAVHFMKNIKQALTENNIDVAAL